METLMITDSTPRYGKAEASIEIDCITYAGSAFAYCNNGDQVFVNARIVEKMELYEGDKCSALLIQNFEDKRAVTPWRAVRVSAIN